MSINAKRKVWGVFLAVFTAIAMIYAADEGTKQPPVAEHDSLSQFTIEQLAKFNGKNGNPAYVAVDSVVYDVTKVKAWKNGEHKRGLKAGNDLSQQILKSPHGKKVLKNLPVVGRLVPTIKADSASAVTPKKELKPQKAPGEK
jgi:predicted heme/steroid binding protein